jgi:hypothetical protein
MTDDSTTPVVPTDNFRPLNIVHKAQVGGQIIFMVIALYLVSTGFAKDVNGNDNLFLMLPIVLGIGGFFFGNNLFQKRIAVVRDMEGSTTDKLLAYRGAYLMRWAMLLAPAIMSTVFFLLTGNYILVGVWLILVTLYIMAGPSRSKMEDDLELDEEVDDLKG